jgi:hypothetical protein
MISKQHHTVAGGSTHLIGRKKTQKGTKKEQRKFAALMMGIRYASARRDVLEPLPFSAFFAANQFR